MEQVLQRLGSIEQRQSDMIASQASLQARLEGFQESFEEFKSHFLGNGQPGVCEKRLLACQQQFADVRNSEQANSDWRKGISAQVRLVKWLVVALAPANLLAALRAVEALLSKAPPPH